MKSFASRLMLLRALVVVAGMTTMATEMSAALIEREAIVRGMIVACLAGEHVALIGIAGTAKSLLARLFAEGTGWRYFEWLLTRFTALEGLFGATRRSRPAARC